MAVTTINRQKVDLNGVKEITFTAPSSASDGFLLDMRGKDNKTAFVFQGAGTVTLKKGNGLQGTGDDLVITVTAEAVVAVDSGAFKIVNGDGKGYAKAIPSATTVKAAVVELP